MTKTEEKIKLEIEYLFQQNYIDWNVENLNRVKYSEEYRKNIKLITHFEMIDTGSTTKRLMLIESKKKHHIVFVEAQNYYKDMHMFFKLVEFPSKEHIKHLAFNIRRHLDI